MHLLKIEDAPRDCLEFGHQLIELGRLGIELCDTPGKSAQICNEIWVLIEDVANRIERVTGRGVELGGFDQVGGNFERDGPSHNRPYVNRRPELRGFSGRRST